MRKQKLRTDDPTKALRKAVKRLDTDQGAVARRNARASVFTELRRLKAFVDKEFPAVRSRALKARTRRTGSALYKHLCAAGWVRVYDAELLTLCAAAGIKARLVTDGIIRRSLVPSWVIELKGHPDFSISLLQRARRSKQFRDIVLMETVFHKGERAKQAVN